nr:putative ribonuclease H-like domain-containing protein [Tanacetum cinerariifolium]
NGINKDCGIDAHEKSANSINDVNPIRPTINTASTNLDIGSLNINNVSPIVSTASPKATHADFLGVKAKRLFLAYASFMGFMVYQMDVKIDFLYGRIKEEEEGIGCDEVFAPVARVKAKRLFLAYASFMGFMVYQMDVKSDFLYGRIKEEVYVCQPLGFEDLDHPDKVYKVVKALYGLHQAPRAWYETLAKYLLDN